MNHRRKAVILITTCIIIISIINILIEEAWRIQVQASSFLLGSKSEKVVLIMADSIELQDIAKNNYLSYLINNSYSSLISGRQNNKPSSAKAKLAIGASKRLDLNNSLRNTVNFDDSLELFDNQHVVGAEGNVIYKDIKYLAKQNIQNGYDSYIGYLGSKLKQNQKVTCLIGNSDTDVANRSSILIAMDHNGIVDMGDVENTTKSDIRFPGGKRTDFGKLTSLYKEYIDISDFIVIDTGDLARLDYYKNQISLEEFEVNKSETINNIADFTRNMIANTKQKTTFILLSTYPSKSNLQSGLKITPIVVFSNNGAGLIYSQSTKRTGIITNLDIADYIIDKLIGTKDSSLKEVPQVEPLRAILSLIIKLMKTSKLRLPVLTWYAIFEIICAMAGLLYMFNLNSKSVKFIKLVKVTMLVNIVAPVVLLYMAIFDISSKTIYFGLLILISFIIAALLFRLFNTSVGQFIGAALFVNVSITIDLLRGSNFIRNSVFGYDPIIGARFYGIGNEFAGVFIGSGILLAGCMLQYYRRYTERKPNTTTILLIAYCSFQLFIMGMPFLGSNFGGTIAGVVAYFFFFCSIQQKRIKIMHLLIFPLIMMIALSSIIVLDLMNPSNTTHIGRFITDIKDNGIHVLYSTLARKAAMNIKLIKYTIWTKVLLCIIVIIAIMFFKPVKLLQGVFKKYKYFTSSWIGISAGSIAGLIVNDSGIVMAATAMIFTGYTILYMCLEERSTQKLKKMFRANI